MAWAQVFPFRTYTNVNGLGSAQVNCLAQDANHFIWVGTDAGISRTDGRSFTNIGTEQGLAGDKVTCIAVDPENRVWAGHQQSGISVIGRDTIVRIDEESGLSSHEVHALLSAKDGSMWVGTFNGLVHVSGGAIKVYTMADGLPSNNIQALAWDENDRLWVGTFGQGIAIREGEGFQPFLPSRELPSGHINGLMSTANGMFIATMDGSFSYDKKSGTLVTVLSAKGPVNALAVRDGALWNGTFNGLARVFRDATLLIDDQNGLPHNEVTCLLSDLEGNLWAGTRNGLVCINHVALTYLPSEGPRPLRAGSIYKDRYGQVWAGNDLGGVYRKEGQRFVPAFDDPDVQDHVIRPVCEDAEGKLWFGTRDFGGMYQWDRQRLFNYSDAPGLRDNNVNVLKLGASGEMLIGTPNGLSRWVNNGFEELELHGHPSKDNITAITQLDNGTVIIGAADGTLTEWKDGGMTELLSADVIQATVNHVVQTERGLYIATEGQGLFHWHKGQLRHFTLSHGLPDMKVRSICAAGGRMCLGTSKGIFILWEKDTVLFSRTLANTHDGKMLECIEGAVLKDGGTLWFGTSHGVFRVHVREFPGRTPSPYLFLERLELFYKPVNWERKGWSVDASGQPIGLRLPFDENYLRFHFRAISTTDPDGVRYRWRLDGFEEEFGPYSTEGIANYPNLPPGTYTLLVEACTGDNACVTEPLSYSFVVRPPFWRTIWFYLTAVLVLVLCVYLYIRWRERKLQHEKRILEATVNERTRELREQKEIVEGQNRHITESIDYARNIQMAILPSMEEMARAFSAHFVIYRPKETVGGDFYWMYQNGDVTWAAAVDCTGHGVAGAFMSMIGSDLLNQIIIEKHTDDPASVLEQMDKGIKLAFAQSATEFEGDNGMDVCLVRVDRASRSITFAGAQRSLYVVQAGELSEWEGDHVSINCVVDGQKRFTAHRFPMKEGMRLFLTTDGYADQFGGSKGKKFMTTRLKEIILSCHDRPMTEQKAALDHGIDLWMGTDYAQVDDILILGIEL